MGVHAEYFSAAASTFTLHPESPEPKRETYGPCSGFNAKPEDGCNKEATAETCTPCAAYEAALAAHEAKADAVPDDQIGAWEDTNPAPEREQFPDCTNVQQFPETCPHWTDCDPCEKFTADREKWERRDLSGLNDPILSLSGDSVARIVGSLPALRELLTSALAKVEAAMTADAVELRDADGNVTGYACPHCKVENRLAEHDKGERWNPLRFDRIDPDGAPVFGVKEADRDFDHEGYVCLDCTQPVCLPENTELVW